VKVRTQLLLAGAPLAVALIVVGLFAVRSIAFLQRSAQSILAQNYRSVLAAQRMKERLERIDDDAYFIATAHPEHAEPHGPDARREFEKELRVEESNITEPGEAEVAAALRSDWNAYQIELDACLALPPGEGAQSCYFRDLRPRFQSLRVGADRVLSINQDAMALKGERARREADRIGAAMIGAVGVALVAALLLSAWLAARALRPLAALGQAVEQLGRGDFAVRAPVRGGAEVAQLATTINAMADHLAEYRKSSLGEMLQAQLAAQSTLDSLSDPVFVFGTSGELTSSNRAAEELTPPGEPFDARRLDPALRDAVDAVRAHVLQGRGPFAPRSFDEVVTVVRPDGERSYLPRASPVYEEGGGIIGATVVLQDVTRLRRFEQLRDDLVSTVAHQFRTPLTSLRMAIHLCLEGTAGSLTDKQQDLLYAAREECERLQGIVDELLDLARLQSGTAELELAPTSATSLIQHAVRMYQANASTHGIELLGEPPVDDATVQADAQRIDLVFSNLIENALRFTPTGGRVAIRGRVANGSIRFEVADTGPGIPESLRPRVFEKFYRAPGSTGGGAGLGLSIARDLVRAHGGQIGVESETGKGSTFWFTIPTSSDGQSS
jgi:two-component system, NtrC family, sensor histidine kinase KinB